jgi:hypothetical protein
VHGQAPPFPERVTARLLAADRAGDLLAVIGLFALFAVIDRWSQALAGISRASVAEPTLVFAAIEARWWLYLPLMALLAIGFRFRPVQLLVRWTDLHQGVALRRLATALLVVLAWRGALYDVNYLAEQTHTADRLLIVLLAAAAWYRPLLIVPFVIQVRIVNQQFVVPFDTTTSVDVDELLVLALIAIAAVHIRYVATGRDDTAPVVLVITAAIAAHFFGPGRARLALDWYSTTEVSDLPLSSYTAGWRRHGDGSSAQFLAELYRVFHRPVQVATLAIELGAAVALVWRRLTVAWLIAAMVFHLMVFSTMGWWFLDWLVLEIALVALLMAPGLRYWHRTNATPARAALAVLAATAGGPLLFHPPDLAWLDGPVSYGYEIEAIGESGTAYHVPASAFAPHDQELALLRLQLGSTMLATGPYGAVDSPDELARLRSITSFAELRAYEATLGPPTITVKSEELVKAFMEHVNRGERHEWLGIGPPSQMWTSRGEPSFDHDEPLTRLEVWRVRSIHDGSEVVEERELVLVLVVNEGGQVLVADEVS